MTQTNNTTLLSYSKEISPMLREIAKKKELLKDFKDSDEGALTLAAAVAAAQEALKAYLDINDDSKEIIAEIKALETEVKEAIKAAAKGSDYKPAELKAFFTARTKDKAVEKTIDKGGLFDELKGLLDGTST